MESRNSDGMEMTSGGDGDGDGDGRPAVILCSPPVASPSQSRHTCGSFSGLRQRYYVAFLRTIILLLFFLFG